MLKPDQWPLKVAFGIGALLIGASDLSFGSLGASPGVLLLLGLLLVAEGLRDRVRNESGELFSEPPIEKVTPPVEKAPPSIEKPIATISIKPRLMKLEERAKAALADRSKTPSQHQAARKVLDTISGSTAMGNPKSPDQTGSTPDNSSVTGQP